MGFLGSRLNSWAHRLGGKGILALRTKGVDFRLITMRSGKISGFRLEWPSDGDRILRGAVVNFEHEGRAVRFFVNDDRDVVQGCHRKGTFYELEELRIIGAHFGGGCFVDVGSNVGNHAIYAARILGATKVMAFEPVDLTSEILSINVGLNCLQDTIEIHKCGLSDKAGRAHAREIYNSNLGAVRLVSADGGGIRLERGDEVLRNTPVDFIKIDTEGFEISALNGLRETLARDSPALFVEVENENLVRF